MKVDVRQLIFQFIAERRFLEVAFILKVVKFLCVFWQMWRNLHNVTYAWEIEGPLVALPWRGFAGGLLFLSVCSRVGSSKSPPRRSAVMSS